MGTKIVSESVALGTKIFAFPVRERRWCFSAVAPEVPAGKYSSVVTLSQLWERFQALPGYADRAELVESFATAKVQQNWSELGAKPIGTVSHRLYSFGQKLLNRLPPEEQFLKTVPRDTPNVELVFPSSLNPRLVRRRLRYLAHRGTLYHQKLLYGSVSLLPFSVLSGILPGPNVFLLWNLFRAHAHWRALQGGTRLQMLLTEGETKAPKSAELNGNSSQHMPWVFTPSIELEILAKPADVMARGIQPSTVSAISKTFGLNTEEVLRWITSKS